jgi:hypothetical protein
MNIGDKLSWAYRSLFILMLLWLRFVEAYIPFWGIWFVWAMILFLIFFYPNRKKPKMADQEISEASSL